MSRPLYAHISTPVSPRRLQALLDLAEAVKAASPLDGHHGSRPRPSTAPSRSYVSDALLELERAEAYELSEGADPSPQLNMTTPPGAPIHPWRRPGTLKSKR